MREIIQVNIGQCGLQVGTRILETTCAEHNIDCTGSHIPRSEAPYEDLTTYFDTSPSGLFVPRTVILDLDAASVENVRASLYGHLFPMKHCVFGQSSTGSNWGKGFYGEGLEIVSQGLETIRRMLEGCEAPQAIQLLFSLGGGTGSGAGSLLLSKLKDEQPGLIYIANAVFPSPLVSDTVVEPYNSVLGLFHLTENADAVITIDNERVYGVAQSRLTTQPSYTNMNMVISDCVASITAPFRFLTPGFRYDWRRVVTPLTPFPKLHYLSVSQASMRESENIMDSLDSISTETTHKIFSSFLLSRGSHSQDSLQSLTSSIPHIDFIPDSQIIWTNPLPPSGKHAEITLLTNNTGVIGTLNRVLQQFSRMFTKKLFLHHWLQYLDEMELTEAEASLNDVISDYLST